MKLLLIGLDGVRLDIALPEAMSQHPGFAEPDHPADPRFTAAATGALAADPSAPDHTEPVSDHGALAEPAAEPSAPERPGCAPTLSRLLDGGLIVPVWMTPPTDSGPGWSSLLTGTTHEENNVWWNEFVGHRLARTPDLLTRIWAANPAARTYAACTWRALVDPAGPGPVIQQRPDQQRGGQHQVIAASDFSRGCTSADQEIASKAAWTLNHEGPDAAFVYFEDVDATGHSHGSISAHYREAIARTDEHVRHLVKAVSERYEQLGEQWLIAVTTDHGHKPEGGHGEDEIDVRRSFLLLHQVGPAGVRDELRAAMGERGPLRSHQVVPLLLELLGVTDGSWRPDHEVGQLRDVQTTGPTRDLRYEW